MYDNGWNAKEIVAYIVFYHEYYASIIKARVEKKKPPLIKETLNKVNVWSIEKFLKFSRSELLNRFVKAQKVLMRNFKKLSSEAKVPYKKNSRIYYLEEYLPTVTNHMIKHTKDFKRKRRKTK